MRKKHTWEGKTAMVAITPDGRIINLNVKNFTITEDQDEDEFLGYAQKYLSMPPLSTYSVSGSMAEIDDSGTIFEIRSPE